MKEIVYCLEDFKERVDLSKPLHHDGWRDPIDEHGIFYKLTFRIYGVSKNGGHILIYESHAKVSTLDIPKEYHRSNNAYDNLNVWCRELFEKFARETAEPLGSTAGRLEE